MILAFEINLAVYISEPCVVHTTTPKYSRPEVESRHNIERATVEDGGLHNQQNDQKKYNNEDSGAGDGVHGDGGEMKEKPPEKDESRYTHVKSKDAPQSQIGSSSTRTLRLHASLYLTCDILVLLVVFFYLPCRRTL